MIALNTTFPEGQEAINGEMPQVVAEEFHESFDHEPQKNSSGKGEQRDLLAETLDKWEMFESRRHIRNAGKNQ